MSERDINYFKLLAKYYGIKEKFFDIKEDIDELEGKKAYYQKQQANVNRELQGMLLKINKLRSDGKADKALKQEMNLKKKEVNVANYKKSIQDIQNKIEKIKLEFQKTRTELEKTESQLKMEFPDKFNQHL